MKRYAILVRNCWPCHRISCSLSLFLVLLAKMCRFSHNAVQIVTMINDEVQTECMSTVHKVLCTLWEWVCVSVCANFTQTHSYNIIHFWHAIKLVFILECYSSYWMFYVSTVANSSLCSPAIKMCAIVASSCSHSDWAMKQLNEFHLFRYGMYGVQLMPQ